MRIGFTIGPMELSPETRRRVGRDAMLVSAWWAAVGLACSTLLLEVAGVRSPLWRYPLTAIVMYALGTVGGLRVWLALFARAARAAPARWRLVTEQERRSDQPRWSRKAAVAGGIVLTPGLVYIALNLIEFFDEDLVVFWTLIVAFAILAVVALLTYPLPAASGMTTLMADLALVFVFGRSFGREFLPHLPERDSWPVIIRETWPQGLGFLVFSAVAGAALVLVHPGAASLGDFFR